MSKRKHPIRLTTWARRLKKCTRELIDRCSYRYYVPRGWGSPIEQAKTQLRRMRLARYWFIRAARRSPGYNAEVESLLARLLASMQRIVSACEHFPNNKLWPGHEHREEQTLLINRIVARCTGEWPCSL
jgi:hypothetical protein